MIKKMTAGETNTIDSNLNPMMNDLLQSVTKLEHFVPQAGSKTHPAEGLNDSRSWPLKRKRY
jgi:hypothetical protein